MPSFPSLAGGCFQWSRAYRRNNFKSTTPQVARLIEYPCRLWEGWYCGMHLFLHSSQKVVTYITESRVRCWNRFWDS